MLVIPNPYLRRGLTLFPVVPPVDLRYWGLNWLTTNLVGGQAVAHGQQLAVAVAGVRAAGDAAPRVVVLVLSANGKDESRFRPEAVREYLHKLRVPLLVWSPDGYDRVDGWGEVEDISDFDKLKKTTKRLMKELHSQWIVWVEGQYLPSEVELDEGLEGIRLAG